MCFNVVIYCMCLLCFGGPGYWCDNSPVGFTVFTDC